MEKSLYRYILKHSARDQILLLALTALSLPFTYMALEVPKLIVNRALSGERVPDSVLGYPLDRVGYLMVLCFTLLGLVLINGGFKYVLNVYRGILGERMLRRLRYELYCRVLRFPLPHFRHVAQGEIIPMITAETEPIGGFIGDSFALPAMQGGLLATYLFFIFNQDPLMGAAAVAIYPLQLWLIPRMQRKVNNLARQRVLLVRKLAGRIDETISGIHEIHANDTSHLERADISRRLGQLYEVRYRIYLWKFLVKFLNNFLNSVTPFFFYAIGGYFVIQGELSLGALVAVLAAYKDLAAPWKELLDYYQLKEDVRVKYAQIIEQFEPVGMLEPRLQDEEPAEPVELRGDIVASNLGYGEHGSPRSLDGASFRIPEAAHAAIVGQIGSGKEEIAPLLARLLWPTTGGISIGPHPLEHLPEAVLGRRLAYVGHDAYLFAGSLWDNLVYGLKHRPQREPDYDDHTRARRERELKLARLTGNSLHDIRADWVDYAAAGATDAAELERRVLEVLELVELDEEVFQLGLHSRLDPRRHADLAEQVLEARSLMRGRLLTDCAAGLVEPFHAERFNSNASLAENLLFGALRDPDLNMDWLARQRYLRQVLERHGLLEHLEDIGRQVAELMVEIFATMPAGHELFEQFSFIRAEDLPYYQSLIGRIAHKSMAGLDEEERSRLLALALMLVPARHRLGVVNHALQARILAARHEFAAHLPEALRESIEFFDVECYMSSATLQDNILFGKLVYGQAGSKARIADLVMEAVNVTGLRQAVIRVGLEQPVGHGGRRLPQARRQKLAIARGLLKRPDILIVNEATGALDNAAELRLVERLRAHMGGRCLIWVLNRLALAQYFDRILVLGDGRVVEEGTYAELEAGETLFRRLLARA